MSRFTMTLITFAMSIVFVLWEGFVLSCLWKWFIVPIFHLPALAVIQASGIALIVGLITRTDQSVCVQEENPFIIIERSAMDCVQIPLFTLIIGYIFSFFV